MLRRMRPTDAQRLGAVFGIDLDESEAIEYAALADQLLVTLDELGHGPDAPPPPPTGRSRRDLGRADAHDDPYNAIARRCEVVSGGEGPLSGTRIAVKDTIAVAGVPLTAGSRVLQGFVPQEDSAVVQRLLSSGAEIVAITNTDYLALSGGGDTSFYGPILNPFDVTRTTGGSSGGSGAALHYDWIDVTLGGDQGGSIRVPASWCGVIGLKPTYSLVPYTGIVGLDPTIDHVGPMGRAARDVAAVLAVIAGKDGEDHRQYDVPTMDYLADVDNATGSLDGVTLGVLVEGLDKALGVDPRVESAFRDAVERLREIGARIIDVSAPAHLRAGPVGFATFLEGMAATAMSGGSGYGTTGRHWPELAAALHMGLGRHADQLSPQSKIMFILGLYLQRQYGGAIYSEAQNLRPALTASYDEALKSCDAILMPTTPGLPHEADAGLSMADVVLRGWAVLGNTSPTNLTGHPAISLPMADVDGLPVGVMAVGTRFGDGALLRLASDIERSCGWFQGELDTSLRASG